jgi:hypothetical protein
VSQGNTGILVEMGAAREVAEVISRLLDDEPGRQAMGRAGITFVRTKRNLRHNYRELARRLEALADRPSPATRTRP